MKSRYYDSIIPKRSEDVIEDPRSCKEIADDIWERIRRKGGNENGSVGVSSKIDP